MLADHRKNKKSALTPKGLRLLRETPFGTPGLTAISGRVAGITSCLPTSRELLDSQALGFPCNDLVKLPRSRLLASAVENLFWRLTSGLLKITGPNCFDIEVRA